LENAFGVSHSSHSLDDDESLFSIEEETLSSL
jgi:hypothetical protein